MSKMKTITEERLNERRRKAKQRDRESLLEKGKFGAVLGVNGNLYGQIYWGI